ncbi:phosphatase [Bacillus haynesii]|nr:phosphatase [Bacillus haynesii]
MKISRILLVAVILGSVATTTYIQSGQNIEIKIAADRVGA